MKNLFKHRQWVICIAFLVLGICGMCQWMHLNSIPEGFTTEEYLQDYDYLWEQLETDYIYFPVLQDMGIDIDLIKGQNRQVIEEQVADIYDYYLVLSDMCESLHCLGHLDVLDYEGYQVFKNNLDFNLELRNVLYVPQTVETYQSLQAHSSQIHDNADVLFEPETAYDPNHKAVIITISSFKYDNKDIIYESLKLFGDYEVNHIIFDITGNPGGNDANWRDGIVALFEGTYTWEKRWYCRETTLTQQWIWNELDPVSVNTWGNDLLPGFVEDLDLTHCVVQCDELVGKNLVPASLSAAQRWLLVDSGTYSSADNFADFCKKTGWATLVGRNTGGDGATNSSVFCGLPNTGLVIRFKCGAQENSKELLAATVGTIPDIISSKYDAPLTTLYDLIDD